MKKFCGKCGTRLDEKTGLCPNCDADKLNQDTASDKFIHGETKNLKAKRNKGRRKSDKKSEKRDKKKISLFIKIIVIILILAILVTAAIFALNAYGVIYFSPTDISSESDNSDTQGYNATEENNGSEANDDINDIDSEDVDEDLSTVGDLDDYIIEGEDAEEFYSENSQIQDIVNAEDSENTYTESEVIQMLSELGLSSYPIFTEYTIDGEYINMEYASDTSTTKHPMYQTYYVNENNEIWTIYVIDNDVLALPVSYNMQSGDTQLLFSESDVVASYDSTTNQFFYTIPDETTVTVMTVERIDAETLESLTINEINNM